MMKMKFKTWDCYIKPGKRYLSGDRIAIPLEDPETGEQIAMATVNIAEEDIPMEPNEVFIKNYSENEGMVDALIEANIIQPDPIKTVKTGYVEV